MILNCAYYTKKYKNYEYYVNLSVFCNEADTTLYTYDTLYELNLTIISYMICQYLITNHISIE